MTTWKGLNVIAVLKRIWLPALMVLAIVVGVASVTQLRSVFGSDGAVVTPVGNDTADKFNPKVVVYEVFGSATTRSEERRVGKECRL